MNSSNAKKPSIMGILNLTRDSFSDGGKYITTDNAVLYAMQMFEDGADIIDIGGESTRPGAVVVEEDIEVATVMPVIRKLKAEYKNQKTAKTSYQKITCKKDEIENMANNPEPLISIDTYKSTVARKALEEGVDIVNDIYALRYDGNMVNVLKDFPYSKIILMHMQGTPETMQINPEYHCVIKEITDFFKERIDCCLANGISENRIILDPGIGFGKNFEQNIKILRNIDKFNDLGFPILLGASRKSFINNIYPSSPQQRLLGSLASTATACVKKIDIVRVHDVKEHRDFINSLSWML